MQMGSGSHMEVVAKQTVPPTSIMTNQRMPTSDGHPDNAVPRDEHNATAAYLDIASRNDSIPLLLLALLPPS